MWNQTETTMGGGGFMSSPGGTGSPSVAGSADKRERIQAVVPVHVSAVEAVPADRPLLVGAQEVHVAVLVGTLEAIERSATKVTYTLADSTGSVQAVHWSDAESTGPDADNSLAEGMTCRMMARVRPGKAGGATSVMCFHLEEVTPEQVAIHQLEVEHAALKIQHVANLAAGGGAGGADLVGGGAAGLGGGPEVPMVMGGGIVGLTPQQQVVYAVIHACQDANGVHKDQVYAGVAGKVPRNEADKIMEFLGNEGHIYNTSDDDHFRATDC